MVNRRVAVSIDADVSPYNRSLLSASASTKAWIKDLEGANDRTAMLVQSALALTPALVPLGAAAVPAIAGLTTQIGFAAVAGGTAMLAFQGVGDALGALNEFQIDPSAKNLEKLNEKLDALGPAGEVFVRQLQDMRAEWQVLQDIAQQEMFPGLTEGIESTMTQMPRFERVIGSVASALGELSADAGADLAGPEWSEFFDYLDREAGPILEAMGKSLGNMFEGLTNMVMAFDPLSDSFTAGMLEMSEAFVEWSDGLDSSQGFQEFVRYIQESGPQAMETLGAIASALVEFVEAAAPVGAVVLPVLEVLADVLAGIADSPAGPVIVGAAAAVGVLGRSLALLSAVGLRGGGESLIGKVFAADKIKAGVAALDVSSRSTDRARMSVTAFAAAEEKRTAAMKAGAAQFGKNAAMVGGFALATTGVADEVGLSNTAMFTAAGLLAGPWGAAVGGGVGLLMDMKGAANEATAAVSSLVVPKSLADLDGLGERVDEARARISDLNATTMSLSDISESFSFSFADLFGGQGLAEMAADVDEVEDQAQRLETAYAQIALALGEDFKDDTGRSLAPTLEELTAAASQAAPAMDALGISADDLQNMTFDEVRGAAADIAQWTTNADSAEGRTRAVADAFRVLDSDLVATGVSADALTDSLDALLDPGLSLSAANDAWTASLRELKVELDENNKTLRGNSDAALANRAAIRDRVGAIKEVLSAEANAGASAGELSKRLRTQRAALLDAGDAAGVSRKELNSYLDTIGLTPKLVKTLMRIEISDAEAKAEKIRARLVVLGNMKPSPKVDAKIEAAQANLAKVEAHLARLDGTGATTYVRTVRTGTGFGPQDPRAQAFGGTYRAGHPLVRGYDMGDVRNAHQPQIAAGGEWRVWAEPETQGESYIPHANDGRRPRARAILEETAGILGARSVEWFADGSSGKDKDGKKRKPLNLESAGDRTPLDQMPVPAVFLAWAQAANDAADKAVYAARRQQSAADLALETAKTNDETADKALATVQASYDSVMSTTAGLFTIDPLAKPEGPSSIWDTASTIGDPFESLQDIIDRSTAFDMGSAALAARGLDGEALTYGLGSEERLAQLSAMSDADLARFEEMFNQAQTSVAATAIGAANLTNGPQLAAATATAAATEAVLQQSIATSQMMADQLDAANRYASASVGHLFDIANQISELGVTIPRGIAGGAGTVARRGSMHD